MKPGKRRMGPLNPAENLIFLTDVRKGGTRRRSFPAGKGGKRRASLSDSEWFDLVERLIALSPDDFTATVVAARLYRRFEEGTRVERGQ